jgi:hypothetical protein
MRKKLVARRKALTVHGEVIRRIPMVTDLTPRRYLYHCFPRRHRRDETGQKALAALRLMINHGLLLTPEIEKWRDSKMTPGTAEDYQVVSRRCCFTDLAEHELPRHMETFGTFALEFEPSVLRDLGAVPVFYVPQMDGISYGPGPALVTQLAHVQDMLSRIAAFRKFAAQAAGEAGESPVLAANGLDGGLVLGVPGSSAEITIPRSILERATTANPGFCPPSIPPGQAVLLGVNAPSLQSLLNIIQWGLHDAEVLVGTVKALGSLFYSTERVNDPQLSHYQQREWRIIGGMKKDTVELSTPVSHELREQLLDLDREYFERELEFPCGRKRIVDQCEVFAKTSTGESVFSCVRRIFCPAPLVDAVRDVIPATSNVEIIGINKTV